MVCMCGVHSCKPIPWVTLNPQTTSRSLTHKLPQWSSRLAVCILFDSQPEVRFVYIFCSLRIVRQATWNTLWYASYTHGCVFHLWQVTHSWRVSYTYGCVVCISSCKGVKGMPCWNKLVFHNGLYSRVFQKTQSISDQVPLLVCSVTIISKTSPKKLDNFDENWVSTSTF